MARLQTEATIQESCVQWFRWQYGAEVSRLLFHSPNGGYRHTREAVKFKRMGVVPGVADLILMIPNSKYHALCFEMKNGKQGRQTDNQKIWQRLVEKRGYKYVVVRSLEEFITMVREYLNEDNIH